MNLREAIMMMAAAIAANMAESLALPLSDESRDLIAVESVKLALAIEAEASVHTVSTKAPYARPLPTGIPK